MPMILLDTAGTYSQGRWVETHEGSLLHITRTVLVHGNATRGRESRICHIENLRTSSTIPSARRTLCGLPYLAGFTVQDQKPPNWMWLVLLLPSEGSHQISPLCRLYQCTLYPDSPTPWEAGPEFSHLLWAWIGRAKINCSSPWLRSCHPTWAS
ncbi:hypothetical protein BJX61DRAFT_529978 [Aspergillus egyptiacus]|nr:hypothetical protein BJX61DRAFT_529978 [Aspergillus egyptiacus]